MLDQNLIVRGAQFVGGLIVLCVLGIGVALALGRTLPDEGEIVFSSNRDHRWQLYRMDVARRMLFLIPGQGDDNYYQPTVSPDGRYLTFWSRQDINPDIYVMDMETRESWQLTHSIGFDIAPAWSPDGKKIAFQSDRDQRYDIYVVNADGSNLQRLTSNGMDNTWPAWSPDGRQMAFVAGLSGNTEIYVMDTDGKHIRQLTTSFAEDYSPAWSPDGKRIAFMSNRTGNFEVYVVSADCYRYPGGCDNNLLRLTDNNAEDYSPTWSPDGERFIFMSNRTGNFEIWVMDADGNNQIQLTDNQYDDYAPAWIR